MVTPKELTYINGMVYSTIDGGGEPDRQELTMGDEIKEAIIAHTINVAENATGYQHIKFKPQNHSYYTVEDNTYVVEEDGGSESVFRASGLPMYLTGWQTANQVLFDGAGDELDQTLLDTYWNGGNDSNLNLYAVWGGTKFIRVIVSTFDSSRHANPDATFRVEIEAPMSYTSLVDQYFNLSPKFKETVDNSNVSTHLTLKFNGTENSSLIEVGTGHGCPKTINGTRYPTYFGFKPNSSVTVNLTVENSNFIPAYIYDAIHSVVEYDAFLCGEGLSRDFFDKTELVPMTLVNGNVWTATLTTPTTDKTYFVQLVPKPYVTITVYPEGSGGVHGEGFYMPGDVCALRPDPAPGNTLDSITVNGVPLPSPYEFTVTQSTNVVATFTTPQQGNLEYSYYCYDGTETIVGNQSAWHHSLSDDNTKVYCTENIQTANYNYDTVRVFEAERTATSMVNSTPVTNNFVGFKRYTGNVRNPSTDMFVQSIDTGGRTIRADVKIDGIVKIYAYYTRENDNV